MIFSQHRRNSIVKRYGLRLFVTGATGKSSKAITNVTQLCERHIAGEYELEIVDIYQQPELARGHEIIAAPTLVRYYPLPPKRIVGELSEGTELLELLQIEVHEQ
jgi:circadian clock protein KaiB